MKILVTGGLGYIGSHTVVELSKEENEIVIVDNLSNAKIDVLDSLKIITGHSFDFYNYDVSNSALMEKLFEKYNFDSIIHFAGFKAVGESVSKPLDYYRNNVLSTIVLADLCIKHNVKNFVFSSSATVYGNQPSPLVETLDLKPTTNPYGETKAMSERILTDTAKANTGFNVALLRYFNPVGAHASGLIGEDPNGIPNNLMPYVTKVAKGILKELSVFGDDYDTPDGTGVRDYVHVVDLAKGHVAALNHMNDGVHIYNLGTGKGTSVLEIVHAFKDCNHIDLPYKIVGRRPGDIATSYADVSKANKLLNWKAELTINEMVVDAWKFENKHSD